MTNQATNKRALMEFYAAFYNEKRFDDAARLLAENFVNHHPGATGKGRQGMIDDFSHYVRHLPDFHIDARRLVAEGDEVWTHNLISGLPDGAQAISVEIWRFEEGAIAEHWDVGQGLKPGQSSASMF